MKEMEKLTAEIMKQMSDDGTPVTKEEAQQMAKMEIGAKQINRYTVGEKKKNSKPVVRKIDPNKAKLFDILVNSVETAGIVVTNRKNEAEFSFLFDNSSYSVKLIKHRPKKKQLSDNCPDPGAIFLHLPDNRLLKI